MIFNVRSTSDPRYLTVNRSRVEDLLPLLEEPAPQDGQDDSHEIVHVEQEVEDGDYRHAARQAQHVVREIRAESTHSTRRLRAD